MQRRHRTLIVLGLAAAATLAVAAPVGATTVAASAAGTTTTTTLRSDKTSSSYDSFVMFTADVAAASGTPTGSVTFTDVSNGSVLATQKLSNGTASVTTAALAPGARRIVARYNGSSSYPASTSNALGMPVAAAGSDAVAYQNDAAHDGNQPIGALRASSLLRKWQVNLYGGYLSYPVIAGGRIFVTAGNGGGGTIWLYALNPATGHTDWSALVANNALDDYVTLAYDGQRVFAYSSTGTLTAYAASTGHELWVLQLTDNNTAFSAPPAAYDGDVYVSTAGAGGTVYAISEADGRVRWAQGVMNGNNSSPAVNDSGAYVSYDGQQDYRFSLGGRLIWHYSTGLEGGGGSTPVLHSGSVYARGYPGAGDTPVILSAASGKATGTFASDSEPALAGTTMYTINSGDLVASAASGSPVRWSFSGRSLDTAPVTNNGVVYALSTSGKVFGVSAASGTQVWSSTVGRATNGPILSGIAIGGGLLVVPAGSYLTAFGD